MLSQLVTDFYFSPSEFLFALGFFVLDCYIYLGESCKKNAYTNQTEIRRRARGPVLHLLRHPIRKSSQKILCQRSMIRTKHFMSTIQRSEQQQ